MEASSLLVCVNPAGQRAGPGPARAHGRARSSHANSFVCRKRWIHARAGARYRVVWRSRPDDVTDILATRSRHHLCHPPHPHPAVASAPVRTDVHRNRQRRKETCVFSYQTGHAPSQLRQGYTCPAPFKCLRPRDANPSSIHPSDHPSNHASSTPPPRPLPLWRAWPVCGAAGCRLRPLCHHSLLGFSSFLTLSRLSFVSRTFADVSVQLSEFQLTKTKPEVKPVFL